MKDMCALKEIGELIKVGVTSFKIEGRMRQEDYVFGVTKMYREYIDKCLCDIKLNSKAKIDDEKVKKDMKTLLKLYNKGGFTNYFEFHNSDDMIQRYERK